MTTPENITVSLEWAKKLKEAGWPQDGSFFYLTDDAEVDYEEEPRQENFAAPTAEELLRRLPAHFIDSKRNGDVVGYDLHCQKLSGMEAMSGANWKVWYFRVRDGIELAPIGNFFYGDTLANAAAAMWCYLMEHNLLPS